MHASKQRDDLGGVVGPPSRQQLSSQLQTLPLPVFGVLSMLLGIIGVLLAEFLAPGRVLPGHAPLALLRALDAAATTRLFVLLI